jgi:uncharacterized protein
MDKAELMTTSAREELGPRLNEMEDTYQQSLVIVTLSDLEGKNTIEDYAAEYSNNLMGDSISLYICMGTRDIYIHTAGLGQNAVNDYGSDYIYEEIIPLLSSNKFDEALEKYTDLLDDFLNQYKNGSALDVNNPYKESFFTPFNILITVGVSAIIALITVLAMKSKLKSVRPQTIALNYVNDFNLTGQRDIYLYSHVTKTAKPKEKSGGSSGGGFGGGSGGGGARKF